jgi:hypothetical protein
MSPYSADNNLKMLEEIFNVKVGRKQSGPNHHTRISVKKMKNIKDQTLSTIRLYSKIEDKNLGYECHEQSTQYPTAIDEVIIEN